MGQTTAEMQSVPVFDLREFVDQQPLGRYQLLIIAMCAAVLAMDGFDAQSIAYVAPVLVKQLHITKIALGPLFSSGLFGMMIGALALGPLADRIGRKPVLVACTLTFGLFTIITVTAHSLHMMMVFRFLAGLGLGGTMPNAIALTSEYAPKRFKATAIIVIMCGFSLGSAFGGFLAAFLIARFGWQSVFVAGGVLPCIMVVVLLILLPESIRFLLLRGGKPEKAIEHLSRIAPRSPLPGQPTVREEPQSRFLVKQLFASGRVKLTLSLWVMFFMNLLNLYFLYSWLPTIMYDAGIKVEKAIVITALFQVGGTIGALTLGRFIDRSRSRYQCLAWIYVGVAVFVFLIGSAGFNPALLVLTISATGFFVVSGQHGANAFSAESYPTAIRSTGVGWANAIGRVGSMAGPILGGMLLVWAGDPKKVFWAAALPALLASGAAFSAAYQTNKRAREESQAPAMLPRQSEA